MSEPFTTDDSDGLLPDQSMRLSKRSGLVMTVEVEVFNDLVRSVARLTEMLEKRGDAE
jgi:hypothetical protein